MNDVYQMLLATFAVVDQPMSDLAIKAMAADLECYETHALAMALQRCRRELRRITLADIIERIEGEHPGVETAWATVSQCLNNESVSVVMTEQMAAAFGVARGLSDDHVAARMAFKESYQREVSQARSTGIKPHWFNSFGTEVTGREKAMRDAAKLNQLTASVMKALPPAERKAIAHPEGNG